MVALTEYPFSRQVIDHVACVTRHLERGAVPAAEEALASTALQLIDQVEQGRLSVETADQVFTLLGVYLSDHPDLPELSEEAQQLLLEGEHLHHFGDPLGPDAASFRALARKVLEQAASWSGAG